MLLSCVGGVCTKATLFLCVGEYSFKKRKKKPKDMMNT